MADRMGARRIIARSGRFLGVASVLATILCAQAQAQQAPADDGNSGETAADQDIIVTAQFRAQRLQDTPIAITAMTGEAIENKALNSVVDVAGAAPNVNIAQGSSAYGGGVAVYIRGIGQYDTSFALEPGVGMYVDDVYHGVLVGSMFDLLDLDRVEVLRGPQGTLAGKNSIGGAIKLYSRRPEGTGEGYLQATLGTYDRIELRGAYDYRLADNLFMRVSGFSKRRDGHVKLLDFACDQPALAGDLPNGAGSSDCQTGTLGGVKAWGLRGALRWLPADNLEINLIGAIVRDDSEPPGAEQIRANNPSNIEFGIPYDSRFQPNRARINYSTFSNADGSWHATPQASTHSESVSGQIDWTLGDALKITSITAYEHLYSVWNFDGDGSPFGIALTQNSSPYHQFTQELRLNGATSDNVVQWTLGGFYFKSKGYVEARVFSAPILNFVQNDPVTNRSVAAYAQLIVHPVPAMSVSAGIRYTDDKKTYEFSRLDPTTHEPAPIVGVLTGTTGLYKGDSVDYRLAVDYRFSDAFMSYASFSTGYKGGGINPRPYIPVQVVPFGSERVDAYEIGFKSDLMDRALRLNVSAFLNKYKDIILIDANGFPGAPGDPDYFPLSAVPFNAGNADIKGIEVETVLRPVTGLEISGSVSYLDFEYKKLDANATASGIGPGYVPPFTPEWKWAISASYEYRFASGATLTPQIGFNYISHVYTDPVNAPTNFLAGYTVGDANLTYRTADRDWEMVVGVTNITDKHYYTNAFDIYSVNGTVSGIVSRPREYYLTLRRNF